MDVFLTQTGQDFTDITLELDGLQIEAHKAILAARCGYFRELFKSSKQSTNHVKVSNSKIYIL